MKIYKKDDQASPEVSSFEENIPEQRKGLKILEISSRNSCQPYHSAL